MMKNKKETTRRRNKGDGGISEYAPGKFRAYLDLGYINGKRKRITITGKNKTEVVRKLNEAKAEKDIGEITVESTMTLSEYMLRWLKLRKSQLKSSTYQGYEMVFNTHIKGELGHLALSAITVARLNDYFQARLKYVSASTVMKHRALLSGILSRAYKEGIIPNNPVSKTEPLHVPLPDFRFLSKSEIEELLSVSRAYYLNEDNKYRTNFVYHIVTLALATGMRRGELCGLRWSRVDTENYIVQIKETIVELKGGCKVDTPKTKTSIRDVYVGKPIIDILLELKSESHDDSYVFCNRDGGYLIPSNMNRAFEAILGLCSFKCKFNDLRHTSISHLIGAGIDVKTVSTRVGHANPVMTLTRYAHVINENAIRAGDIINNVLTVV